MNILYHHRTQGTGAEGVHIASLVEQWRKDGHQVNVISPTGRDPLETAGNNPFANKKGFKQKILSFLSKVLPQFGFELMEMAYNHSVKGKIEKHLREQKVDLIYERQAFFLGAGAELANQYNIPYIVEVNEIAGHDRVRKQFFIKQARLVEQLVFHQADAIIVVSPFLKKQIMKLGINGDKIYVQPNGFNPALLERDNNRQVIRDQFFIKDDEICLGFIGWFVQWHNFDLLLEAVSRSRQLKVKLMLLGDGYLKEYLIEKSTDLGIRDKVIFAGAILHREVPDYIQAMDICIIPGSNEYRSPIKMFEYMGMGKPVIAPKYDPIEMVIDHQQTGMLFEPDSVESFCEQVKILVESRTFREKIGIEAQKKVLDQFLWKHNAQKVLRLYEEIKNVSHSMG